ncbi:MAG: hypothetical protein UW68_C0002G0045 [Candidatus Collierbacteria bacterium GW2011_GWB1_44_6]|uniref:Phage-related protein n=2 Tax=Candidatus Collieribacteriota TaxID=1752725 RepID=A0A0G1JQH7_9BACT|nr:MAG: hypothetical protein UV68_C0003G0009 [Candidatus Collierbacteria bacterium GW2011_GWC2_43_12]KKT73776.1 MAG: hypothetical protein UW68_C0002G0045 [Candidatus Collierbacteria bacterium GW2011_GWB1_44_6]
MGKYKVWLYRDRNGDSPVEDVIKKLNKVQGSKVSRQILHLSEFGISIHNKSLRKLTKTSLWELRILGRDNIRLFCTETKYGICIIHVFVKKSQKTRISEILISLSRLKTIS